MKSLKRVASLFVWASLSWTGSVVADAVVDWNAIAVDAVTIGRPGPSGTLDMALVQAAVHDAVQAIERRYEPYYAEVRGAKGSRAAAATAAAHDVLVGMYPAQAGSLDTAYSDYVANNGLTDDPGLDVGQKVAAAILPLRRLPPNPLPPPFIGGINPGQWRPTDSLIGNPPVPPPFSPMAVPWAADSDPFTLTGPARFRAEPPPALTSSRYAADYNEVKALGAFTGSSRTAEQTDIAYFWSENFIAQWNRAFRAIASQRVHRIGDSARMFALSNLAMADAFITAWDSKRHYFVWRPVTAIHEGDSDGNPNTTGDPAWQSLINNPNYPDYTSGANNLTGAATRSLALFFGTENVTFQVTSNAPLAVKKTRTYKHFYDAAAQVVDARIYLGIHFRFADTAARAQGRSVAEWVVGHFLRPIRDDDDKHW